MGPIKKAGLVAFVAAILLISTLGGYLIYADANEGSADTRAPTGYAIMDADLNEDMTHHPGCLDIGNDHTDARYDFDEDGMSCSFRSPGDVILVQKDERADTVSTQVDITALDLVYRGAFLFEAKFSVGPGTTYNVQVLIDQYRTDITYTCDSEAGSTVRYGDLFYDASDINDLLVKVQNGRVELGLNGIQDVQELPGVAIWSPRFEGMRVGAGPVDPVVGVVHVKAFSLGLDKQYRYMDVLHKTIVPDGMDFAFALQIHADRSYPEQMLIMANLSQEYGLHSTYDAWVVANSRFYSMTDPSYKEALHALQDSGWDIGVHALGYANLNRSQCISLLAKFTAEYGAPRTWSDHGSRPQDLWKDGNDPDSGYYIADLVEQIGAGWKHQNNKAQSFYNDLNRDGMSYQDPDMPDVPLFRVSHMQAWMAYEDPGRENDLDQYLRAWPVERTAMVTHDYLAFFFDVTDENGTFSVLPGHDGVDQIKFGSLIPKQTYKDGEWTADPKFVDFLQWAQGYRYWFAPVRDIYDRSGAVQSITVREDAGKVVIRNNGQDDVHGLTLFTKSIPDYRLQGGGLDLMARKGTGDSWHFVIDLPAGAELVLEKVRGPSDATEMIEPISIGPTLSMRPIDL